MVQPLYPNELQHPELVLEFQGYAPHRSLQVPAYHFWMIDPASGTITGHIDLRNSHAAWIEQDGGHIGYAVLDAWKAREETLIVRAVEMLKPLAFRLGLNPLWMTCDAGDPSGRRIAQSCGGELVEPQSPGNSLPLSDQERKKLRYRIVLGEQYRSLESLAS